VHRVELTTAGEETFRRLVTTVVAFDQRLRAGIADTEIAAVEGVLARLRSNAELTGSEVPS
jgi:MarR family transcriptional regulator for hemolysin